MRHDRIVVGDVQARLARALIASAAAGGIGASVARHRQRPWASATFVGATHDVALTAPRGAALDAWLAALPEEELTVRGHLVASVAVERVEHDGTAATIALAVLTIED